MQRYVEPNTIKYSAFLLVNLLVKKLWDPMPNSDKYNDYSRSSVELLPTFWKKDKDRSWRLDIDLTMIAASGDSSGDEDESESDSEVESDDASESGSGVDGSECSEKE